MHRTARVLAGVFALGFGMSAMAQAPGEDAQRARLEAVVASYTKDNAFMGAVLVQQGDKTLLNKGFGQAVIEWNVPNAPDVKFRLGSITKQFTATLILLLQQDGKLKIEDPVSKYLPDTPKAWEKITLAELLGHTTGIPNFTSSPEFRVWRMNPHTPDELLRFFKDRPLEFAPGTKFAYSNSNYGVLGAVVEKVSGESYGKMLRTRIFEPLGMHDTGLDADDLILPKRAEGYAPGPSGGLVHAVSESMTVPWAAGAIYSTTGDLLLWQRGLFGHKLLNEASLKQMTTPGKEGYALGVFVHPQDGVTVVNHGGGIEGFNTDLTHVPEKDLTVVVLGNVNGNAPGEIGTKLTSLMLGEKVALTSERKEAPLAADQLAKFAGTYQAAPTFALVFRVVGDHLEIQATGQPAFPMFYRGDAGGHPRFFLKVVEAEVEFVPDAAGAIKSLVLHQGGHDLPAVKQ